MFYVADIIMEITYIESSCFRLFYKIKNHPLNISYVTLHQGNNPRYECLLEDGTLITYYNYPPSTMPSLLPLHEQIQKLRRQAGRTLQGSTKHQEITVFSQVITTTS